MPVLLSDRRAQMGGVALSDRRPGMGDFSTQFPLWGPNESIADEMQHNFMHFSTIGYPWQHPHLPELVNPFTWPVDPPNASYQETGLGCCDWCEDDRLGGELMGLGDCPQGPIVVVEGTQIPWWFWWVAGGVAVLFLLKRR